MRGPGRADIVNAGSEESGYNECGGPGRADIVSAGSGESGYSECRVRADRADIVNAGSDIFETRSPLPYYFLYPI
ncbi:unnamed protein product [Staurois parvus]|uniref:Uncharacterized protein n=1 Tax=Staurois parvus TaxID=386267 RepID=A0ABN9BME3_9NEOB|nr:unnamed protein product [Staurois parvus]